MGLNAYCDNGILFFSFSSNKSLADNCVFLLNFFPYNEIETIFDYLPENSKVAIVYPENSYGYKINEIVINHYDLFKIKDPKELYNIGIFEDNSEMVTLVEWPEIISNKPKKIIELYFSYEDDFQRRNLEIFSSTSSNKASIPLDFNSS